VVVLSLIEIALVSMDLIPPVFSYSLGNLIIMTLVMVVVIYAGVVYSEESLRKSVLAGASLGFAVSTIVCIAELLSSIYLKKSVLGISIDTHLSLFILLVLIIALNSILDAFITMLVALLVIKYRK
jgi:ABC-type multidrug transport system permease subunit